MIGREDVIYSHDATILRSTFGADVKDNHG
jgi:hypothetical protein